MASASLLVPQARRSISPASLSSAGNTTTNRNDHAPSQRQSQLLSAHSSSIVSVSSSSAAAAAGSSTSSYKTAGPGISRTSLTSSRSSVHTISATVPWGAEGSGSTTTTTTITSNGTTTTTTTTSNTSNSSGTMTPGSAVNPLYALAGHPQEVHIVKVTNDTVQIEPGPVPADSYFGRIGKTVKGVMVGAGAGVPAENGDFQTTYIGGGDGPPPPSSPPASAEHQYHLPEDREGDGEVGVAAAAAAKTGKSSSMPVSPPPPVPSSSSLFPPPPTQSVIQSDPSGSAATTATAPGRQSTSSSLYSYNNSTLTTNNANTIRSTTSQPEPLQRSSTDTRASYRTSSNNYSNYNYNPLLTPQQSNNANAEASSSTSHSHSYSHSHATKANGHLSVDGSAALLSAAHRPARRNTTGSTPLAPGSSGSGHGHKRGLQGHHGKGASHPYDDAVLGEGGVEIASDIEMHAERIRRERMSKRAKQQQEAEAALTRAESQLGPSAAQAASAAGATTGQDAPLVGNLIGEGHVNYVLMYNMLTGIRIGVSRCQAKIKRPLTDEDFTARHKFSFDIVGNELTPSAKYDFKFKDYAPWVFRYIREDIFGLDPADYLLSLTAKYILSELGSPGKSGSFFYFSRDYRFIIKTIRHSEHKFLLSILKKYYAHIQENPHTLLSRFYGLHRVKLPRGRKIHFVIMNNLFPAHKDVHETYDLKGSTVGREYPEDKAAKNPRAVLKDLNWINREKMLELGPEKRALLTEQLRRDEEFLKSVHVMDYSLLVGIHNMQRGNRENLRRNTLKVFSPNLPETRRSKHAQAGSKSPEAIAMKRAMRSSDPKRLGKHTVRLPEEDTGDRQQFVFYQDEGGLRATDDNNEGMNTIYYLGVIDILTPYTFAKKAEHCWKGLSADRHKISPVPPAEYGDRFFAFMKAIMRGGEGGERFKEKDRHRDRSKSKDREREKEKAPVEEQGMGQQMDMNEKVDGHAMASEREREIQT